MSELTCTWGILGCANIAKKNSVAIMLAKNSRLVAVASRSQAKCSSVKNINSSIGFNLMFYFNFLSGVMN